MNSSRRLSSIFSAALLLTATVVSASAQPATPAAAAPVTGVLVSLTIKAGADRSLVATTMPAEVRETVQAYLDGKILQWFARADGTGVIFIVNAASTADATTIMNALPLAKANLADFTFTPLTPLTPLRMLLAPPSPKG